MEAVSLAKIMSMKEDVSTSSACSLRNETAHGVDYHSCGARIDAATERNKVSLCAGAPEIVPEPACWMLDQAYEENINTKIHQ
jgi:hypothetical protein